MSLFQDGVLILNQQGTLCFADPNARQILEMPEGDLDPDFISHSAESAFRELVERAQSENNTQEHEFVTEHLSVNKNLSILAEPYQLVENGTTGWLVIVRDITSVRRLEGIEKEFITNVSHELRTPLTSIKMAAESLRMGAIESPKFKERFLSNIQREADRLTRLVNELLVISNLEDAKTTLHLSNFDLAGLIDDVMSTMEPHARVNDIELVGDFPDLLPTMYADRDRVLQVLINLVDNAIKCNRPNGTVTLKVELQEANIHVQVVDTGIGIPDIDLPRIFNRFFRVDKSRSRVTGGTGLGLSIVKDIIEAHQGQIDVESTLNVGTTFHIHLPVKVTIEEEDHSS